MGKWEGLGQRIKQRIQELGYKNPSTFADAHKYRTTYIHKWIGGSTPDRPTLERLAKDLKTTPWWLLFGDQAGGAGKRNRPISGGSDAHLTQDGGPGRRIMTSGRTTLSIIWAVAAQRQAIAMVA